MMKHIVNIAAYKFVSLCELDNLRTAIYKNCENSRILGTILLAPEGINLMLAGTRSEVDDIKICLNSYCEFSDLTYKETFSEEIPFDRFKIKIKNEIVPMGISNVKPGEYTGPTISAQELKKWIDEGRDFLLLDTRNDYEMEVGTFENAIGLNLRHFRKFDNAIDEVLPSACKTKPIVMFCTGGIRCEKASPLLINKGFEQVYQLDGGIIQYFQEVGGAHYRGDCFVFDHRTAITPACEETGLAQCERCQQFVTPQEQAQTNYRRGEYCIHCQPKNISNQSIIEGDNSWV
jgi:UPF0176 protein